MPQIKHLLRTLTVDEVELPNLVEPQFSGTPPGRPCSPCSPSTVGPFGQREAFVFQPQGHPKQAFIDGEIWPPIFKADFVRSAKRLSPLPTDVFVCTYPKCGTTWIQHICSQLMTADYGPEVGKVSELCVTSPMIERMGARFTDNIKHPRLLKTHFNWQNCPKSSKTKYIYAARNPKDCLTSYYFHNRNFKIYDWADGDFHLFFELFCAGKLAFGDYFDHLLSWLPHLHKENVLFLKYEDMYNDLETAIVKIGQFIGGRAAQLVANEESLRRIVAESRIDSMKQNQGRWFPGSVLHNQTFIRKGGSRDWKNYMSREQSDKLDELFRRKLAGTPVVNWWMEEMSWDEPTLRSPQFQVTPDLLRQQLQIKLAVAAQERGDEERDDGIEVDEMVRRRNSFSTLQPSLCLALVPYGASGGHPLDRRSSLESFPATILSASTSGYASRASSSGSNSPYSSRNSLSP